MTVVVSPLAAVLAGHFLGDWIVQTDWQAATKVRPTGNRRSYCGRRRYWRSWKANQQHMLGYHLTMFVALAFARADVKWTALILAISWVTHSIIDRRWPVRWLCDRTGSHGFGQTTFGVIAVDQALHLSILCVLAGSVR